MTYRRTYAGDPRWMTAKYGNCANTECNAPIAGKKAYYFPSSKKAYCEKCGEEHYLRFESEKSDEENNTSM